MFKKTILLIVILVCLTALLYLSFSGEDQELPPALSTLPASGENPGSEWGTAGPAPDFSLPSLEGRKVSLKELRGKVVVLNFWSSTCMFCLLEMPSLEKLAQMMAGKPFEILAITTDPRPMVERAVQRLNLRVPVLLDPDGSVSQQYKVYALPVTYIIAPDGTINNKVMGAANWGHASAVNYLNQLLLTTPPPKTP